MGNSEKPRAIETIHFLTVGPFAHHLAEELVAQVSRRVSVPCRIVDSWFRDDPPMLPERGQVDADSLLSRLEEHPVAPQTIRVAMTMLDIAIPIFTFVFGRARRHGHTALVSLARLRPEFYGIPADPDLTVSRAVAEILHEIGHIAGLIHCNDFSCLMHFATNAETIDLRGETFCAACASTLPPGLVAPPPVGGDF